MRVIKFRVWDGENMISPDTIDRHGVARWITDSIPNMSKKLMQFTGLHDKNGKEIYEGDIIQWGGENEPMVVAWSDKYASFGINRSGWMYMHFFGEAVDNTDCEVIGNIHENPDLLK